MNFFKSNKFTAVCFGAMAFLTLFQIFSYQGSESIFQTDWIWYLPHAPISAYIIDGLIFGTLTILAIWNWFNFKINLVPKIYIVLVVLCALLIKPVGSSDFAYFFTVGNIANNGQNIYLEKNWQIQNFGSNNDKTAVKIRSGLTYGPLTVPIFKILYNISDENLIIFTIIFKIFNLIGVVLVGFVVESIRRTLGNAERNFSVYSWLLLSPLILFEVVVNGHFEVWWVLFLLSAIYFAIRDKWELVLPSLAVGMWIKILPIFTVPIFLIWFVQKLNEQNYRKMLSKMALSLLGSIAISVLIWSSLWSGISVFSALANQASWVSMTFYHLIYETLGIFYNYEEKFRLFITILNFTTLVAVGFSCYLVWPVIMRLWKVLRKKESVQNIYFIKVIFLEFVVYLALVQRGIFSWYFVWPVLVGLLMFHFESSKYFNKLFKYISLIPLSFYFIVYFFIYILKISSFGSYYFYVLLMSLLPLGPIYYLWQWRKENYQ